MRALSRRVCAQQAAGVAGQARQGRRAAVRQARPGIVRGHRGRALGRDQVRLRSGKGATSQDSKHRKAIGGQAKRPRHRDPHPLAGTHPPTQPNNSQPSSKPRTWTSATPQNSSADADLSIWRPRGPRGAARPSVSFSDLNIAIPAGSLVCSNTRGGQQGRWAPKARRSR